MEMEFKNGSKLKTINSEDNKRSLRAEELREFYKKYPDVFIEEFFDIKLLSYQKLIVRALCKDDK